MLENTLKLKSKLERSLTSAASLDEVKSVNSGRRISVIKVVAQESIIPCMRVLTKKRECTNRHES